MRFYATNRVDLIRDAPADGSHRAPSIAAVGEPIQRSIQHEGEFRVPKTYGYFVADVED